MSREKKTLELAVQEYSRKFEQLKANQELTTESSRAAELVHTELKFALDESNRQKAILENENQLGKINYGNLVNQYDQTKIQYEKLLSDSEFFARENDLMKVIFSFKSNYHKPFFVFKLFEKLDF